jgi:hypothetical protein
VIAPRQEDVDAYHEAVAEARRAGLVLAGEGQDEILALLAEWAEELAVLVERGAASGRLRDLYREVREMYVALGDAVASAVEAGVGLTTRQVALIHAQATTALTSTAGVGIGPGFQGVDIRAAQAVIARGDYSRAIKSFRRDTKRAGLAIIQRGQLRGAPTTAVARELRMHIGAPGSLLEGDAAALRDRRRIGYKLIEELGYEPTPENLALVRSEAGKIAERAQLIARSERINGEHEAHARTLAVSPVVAFVRVRVSYRHRHRDQCDTAAEADLFGLGQGCYPPERVPARFHPRCLCPFSHELRDPSEWGSPRPQFDAWAGSWADLRDDFGLSPSQAKALAAAIRVGDARAEDEAPRMPTRRFSL